MTRCAANVLAKSPVRADVVERQHVRARGHRAQTRRRLERVPLERHRRALLIEIAAQLRAGLRLAPAHAGAAVAFSGVQRSTVELPSAPPPTGSGCCPGFFEKSVALQAASASTISSLRFAPRGARCRAVLGACPTRVSFRGPRSQPKQARLQKHLRNGRLRVMYASPPRPRGGFLS